MRSPTGTAGEPESHLAVDGVVAQHVRHVLCGDGGAEAGGRCHPINGDGIAVAVVEAEEGGSVRRLACIDERIVDADHLDVIARDDRPAKEERVREPNFR